ncbi:RCC1 domain-containing protein, partial [Streptomyces sp. NPDC054933]
MLLAHLGRPLWRRITTVAVAALMATAASPGTSQAAMAHGGKPGGTALAWGANAFGQLGDGTTMSRTTPVRVCRPGQTPPCTPPLQHVRAMAGGGRHSLALLPNGTVLAWGNNTFGQLGDGTTMSRTTPVRVCAVGQTAPCTRFLTGVRAISAQSEGVFSMALRLSGTVLSWGDNGSGQLGDGTTMSRTTPVRVCAPGQTAPCTRFLRHVRAISAGSFLSLALRPNGTVLSWGANSFGELGDGTTINRLTPVRVCAVGQTAPCTRFLTGVRAVFGGGLWSIALRWRGAVLSWGLNTVGELGDGTTTSRTTPVRVCAPGQTAPCTRFLIGVRAIAAGGDTTLALRGRWPGRPVWRPRGAVLAWGLNTSGQVGDGTTINRLTPVRVCAVGQTAPCTRFLTGVR